MKTLLLVAALIAVAQGTLTKGLRIKWALDLLTWGETSYMEVPSDLTTVKSTSNWTQMDRTDCIIPGLVMYCYTPGSFICGLYENDTELVAGVRYSIPKELISTIVLDMETQGFKEVTYSYDGVDTDYWFSEVLFISEESQYLDVTTRTAARDTTRTLCEKYLWIQRANDEWMKIAADYDEFIADTTFTEQACIPFMGHHYYDSMSNNTQCTAEELNKHFVLMHSGEMVGLGIMMYPSFTLPTGQRDWCEHPTTSDVKTIVTSGPSCLYDMVDNYGVTTSHMYFIEKPRTSLTCLDTLL